MNVESFMPLGRVAMFGTLLALSVWPGAPLTAQSPMDLAGSWTLNRQLSQFPQELGFSATFLPTAPGPVRGASAGRGGGRGGRRGGGNDGGGQPAAGDGLGGPRLFTQTEEDARRVRFLTDEVRLPPERLTIVVTPAIVTITPDRGAARTVQPGKRDDAITIGPITAVTNATWEADRLAVVYRAETGRLLRYTYVASQNPAQLTVEVEFVERGGGGDRVRRVYEPTRPSTESSVGPTPGSPFSPSALRAAAAGGLPDSSAPAGSVPASPPPGSGNTDQRPVDQRPDASLRGLTRLGLVLEGLGADAAKCGLKAEALDAAVAKHLTDAGFRVVHDADDDSYLYVNVNTVTASSGLCVSRYDVTLYSHAAAQLAHTTSPVLVQVELLHKGGLAGGAAAAHADGVVKGVLEYVDQFASRVKNAGR